jgi:hypothetical protein
MSEPQTFPAPVLDLQPTPPSKWERERNAFRQLLPQLLATHRGKYIAIHEGKVVGVGEDLVPVALQAHRQYGRVAIYVDLVSDQPPRPVRISWPRTVRSETAP